MTGLFLKDLRLSHFRSHKAAHLELDGRPLALFGANGAGKTNILEAVSLLSPGRGLRRARAGEMARRPEALGWKVSGVLQSLHQEHELETWSEGGAGRSVRIDGKAAPQVALGRLGRVLWLVPSMDRLWSEGADGRRRFLDRMTLSFEPGHGDVVLRYEKAMRERNRLLKDQVRDPAWFGALEAQMAESGARIYANRSVTLAQLTGAMAQAETSFPIAGLQILFADGAQDGPQQEDELLAAFQDDRPRDFRAGRSLTGPHRCDLQVTYTAKALAARDCSTGEQKALLISLILANGRALVQEFGAPPILLLDEIAAHLDADRRAALYDEICKLRAQTFMTGTGAELFEALGARATYCEVKEQAGVSTLVER